MGTTQQQTASVGALELRLANVRKLYPIYLAFAQEVHLSNPPARSLTSVAPGTEAQVVQALESWMDGVDARIQARELRLALQNTKLATSEPEMHALLTRYLGKEMKTIADRAKIDFLLAQYFAFSAPPAMHDRTVSIADVAGVLQAILGPFPVRDSKWVGEIEKLVGELRQTRSLRDVRERGIIERGRTIKTHLGEDYSRPEHLIACTWLNYQLRRRCSELMKVDLQEIDGNLAILASRGVTSLDCSAVHLSTSEAIAALRQTCRTWTPPTSSDYAAAPPFTRVLSLLSIVDGALHANQAPAEARRSPAPGIANTVAPKPQPALSSTTAPLPASVPADNGEALGEDYRRLSSDLFDLRTDFRTVAERLRESLAQHGRDLGEENKRLSTELSELRTEYQAVADRLCEMEEQLQSLSQASQKPIVTHGAPPKPAPIPAPAPPKPAAPPPPAAGKPAAPAKQPLTHPVTGPVAKPPAPPQAKPEAVKPQAAPPKITETARPQSATAVGLPKTPQTPPKPATAPAAKPAPPKPASAATRPSVEIAPAPVEPQMTTQEGAASEPAAKPEIVTPPLLAELEATKPEFRNQLRKREGQLRSALSGVEAMHRRIVPSNLKLDGVTMFLTASEIGAFLQEPSANNELVRAGVATRYYLMQLMKVAEKSGECEPLEQAVGAIQQVLAGLHADPASPDSDAVMEASRLLARNLHQAAELLSRSKAHTAAPTEPANPASQP